MRSRSAVTISSSWSRIAPLIVNSGTSDFVRPVRPTRTRVRSHPGAQLACYDFKKSSITGTATFGLRTGRFKVNV